MDEQQVLSALKQISAKAEAKAKSMFSDMVAVRAQVVVWKAEATFSQLWDDPESKAMAMATKEQIAAAEAEIAELEADIEDEIRDYYIEQVQAFLRRASQRNEDDTP